MRCAIPAVNSINIGCCSRYAAASQVLAPDYEVFLRMKQHEKV